MATAISGTTAVTANTDTTLLNVAAGKQATCTVNVCNRGTSDATVRIALSATATPATSEYIEYDVVVPASGVLERGGLVRPASTYIVVRSSSTSVSFNYWGFQE